MMCIPKNCPGEADLIQNSDSEQEALVPLKVEGGWTPQLQRPQTKGRQVPSWAGIHLPGHKENFNVLHLMIV